VLSDLAQGKDPLGDLLGRLVAVSEQYPDMKSGRPFELLMEKIVEIEDRLAAERERYNDSVNIYTTLTASFPGRLFASVFGFEAHTLFSADPNARPAPAVGWPPREALAQRPTPSEVHVAAAATAAAAANASAGSPADSSLSRLGKLTPSLGGATLRSLLETGSAETRALQQETLERLLQDSTAP
jgi:hypothetical protein